MRTNDLFRDLLDNKIPGHETPTTVWVDIMPQTRPRFYFLPTLPDRTAPTMADLAEAVEISNAVELTGLAFDDMAETMRRVGDAARNCRCCIPAIDKPTPTPPWGGSIATQKRRRKL